MEIAFNPQFFIEGIESVETEELVLRLTSPLRPGLLQAAGLRGLLLPRDADPADGLAGPRPARRDRIPCGSPGSSRSPSATSPTRAVELAPGLTVVHGPNGAGKTNLLEALFFGADRPLAADAPRA